MRESGVSFEEEIYSVVSNNAAYDSLLFGAKTVRHILTLVTAFTIAHSITLALATLQIVQLPSKLVESAIALSIIYVALINIFNKESKHQHPAVLFYGQTSTWMI